MNLTETYLSETKAAFSKKLSSIFLSLTLFYVGCTGLAYLMLYIFSSSGAAQELYEAQRSYYVSCPLNFVSVYGMLSSLAVYLKSTVIQTIIIFFSAFTFFPGSALASAAVMLYRGICTGTALFLVSAGRVGGISPYPQLSLSLYFLTSVFLIIYSAYACIYSRAIIMTGRHGDDKNFKILLFEYIKCFMVFSGCILTAYTFAIIFS